jgi:protein phosphatase
MGRNVQLSHGLKKTTDAFEKSGLNKKDTLVQLQEAMPYYRVLDDGKLVVVHGAWRETFLADGPRSKKCRTWCLFCPNKGMGEDGFPIRIDWVRDRLVNDNSATIVYGHQPYREVRIENKTYGIDTGCVFGGKLTALRYPEMEIVQVPARQNYSNKPTKWGTNA